MKVTLLRLDGLDAAMIAASCCVSSEMPTEPKPAGLLRAVRSGHLSVLEHAVATFAVEGISRVCSHQLVRHRLASYSMASQRYVNMEDFEYVMPETIEEGEVSFTKEVRGETVEASEDFAHEYREYMSYAQSLYSDMVAAGIPEEDARYVLPNACCTNIVVTMNARELGTFFRYRLCDRAQWEIRELAQRMYDLCMEISPEIFGMMGPNCKVLGYCPEAKGCGRVPRREQRWRYPTSLLSRRPSSPWTSV